MLPIEIPKAPSDNHASSSGRVSPLEAHPNFSIRDYAFTLRRKDVETNWPFRPQYLKLCLKHGVKDVLPPFEPPDLVRARCCTKGRRSSQDELIANKVVVLSEKAAEVSKHEPQLPSKPSVLKRSYSSPTGTNEQRVDRKRILDDVEKEPSCVEARYDSTHLSAPHPTSKVHRSEDTSDPIVVGGDSARKKVGTVPKPYLKKCRLVLKVGPNPEAGRVPEISSNSSMVCDSMASKVCPVCKTFSSSSNTTLNAHIDQCLSVESNVKQLVSTPIKHRVKPCKIRSIVDIYSTAIHCTLEDLDRRNGSSWALDSRSVALAGEACTERKRPKLCPVEPTKVDNGAVYVDSTGKKVCILSKLNKPLLEPIGESSKLKIPVKDINQQKFLFGKKRVLAAKYLKHKFQNKKSCSTRLHNDKSQLQPEGETTMEIEGEKNDSRDETANSRFASLRQKIRLKKTGAISKLNEKLGHKTLALENKRSHLLKSAATRSHVGPSNDFSLLKTKKVKTLWSEISNSDEPHSVPLFNSRQLVDGVPSKPNVLKLHLRKSSTDCSSSLRSKSMEIHKKLLRKSGKVFPLKNSSQSKQSLFSDNVDNWSRKGTCFTSKKLRSCRSLNKCSEKTEVSGSVNDELSGELDVCPTRNYSSSNDEMLAEAGNVDVQLSSGQSNCLADAKRVSLERSDFDGELRNHEGENVGMATESPDNVYTVVKSPFDRLVGDHPCRSLAISDGQMSVDNAHGSSSLQENEKLIGGTEAWVELFAPRSTELPKMPCSDEASDGIIGPDIESAGELEYRECGRSGSTPPYMDFQADEDHARGSNACLTSPRVSVAEAHQDHSCVTSSRIALKDDQKMVTDRELSGSPISAASTISHPSMDDLKHQDSEPEMPAKCAVVSTDANIGFPNTLQSSSVANSGHTERVNEGKQTQEAKGVAASYDPTNLWERRSCCCSHGENAPYELQPSEQGAFEGEPRTPTASNFYGDAVLPALSDRPSLRIETPNAESMSARSVCEDVVRRPPSRDFGSADSSPQTQLQCSPNPVLRLMGKNLMVGNQEDEHNQLPKTRQCTLNKIPDVPYSSLVHGSSRGDVNHSGNQHFHHLQFFQGSTVVDCSRAHLHPPTTQMTAFPPAYLQNGMMAADMKIDQERWYRAPNFAFTYNVEEAPFHHEMSYAARPPNKPREVIVIDDSLDTDAEQKRRQPRTTSASTAFSGPNQAPVNSFSCSPPGEYPFQLKEIAYGAKPAFTVSYPRADVHSVLRRSPFEPHNSFLPRQYQGPSRPTGHLQPTLFYSRHLQ